MSFLELIGTTWDSCRHSKNGFSTFLKLKTYFFFIWQTHISHVWTPRGKLTPWLDIQFINEHVYTFWWIFHHSGRPGQEFPKASSTLWLWHLVNFRTSSKTYSEIPFWQIHNFLSRHAQGELRPWLDTQSNILQDPHVLRAFTLTHNLWRASFWGDLVFFAF